MVPLPVFNNAGKSGTIVDKCDVIPSFDLKHSILVLSKNIYGNNTTAKVYDYHFREPEIAAIRVLGYYLYCFAFSLTF